MDINGKLVRALEVCYASLQTYGKHPIVDRQVTSTLTEAKARSNGNAGYKEPAEEIYKKGYDAGFEKGLYEGQAKQAILELQGRDKFIATLREKIKKGEKI